MSIDASPKRRAWPIRFLASIWRGLIFIRTAFFNFLTLVLLLVVLAALFQKDPAVIPHNAPLLLSPSGVLVDQRTYTAPSTQLMNMGNQGAAETVVHELVSLIDQAASDTRINGIVLHLDRLSGGGLSKLQEIGAALDRFRATGKPVIAMADSYSQTQYFLASYADEIFIHDMGTLALTGFGLYRNYFKEALDKLAVKFHVFKVGEFKDFVEPYTRNDMSDQSREHNRQWLESLWQEFTQHVETRRQLPAGSLTPLINDIVNQLATTQGNTAQLAVQQGLVDHAVSRQERSRILIERFGSTPDDADKPLYVEASLYKRLTPSLPQLHQPQVALIVASGTIRDGYHAEGTIGGDSLTELIRKARQDDQVKALVLRIDSGGGSAFASEIIRQELQQLRDIGKPVVVSMGGMAASGGYWIAMAADQVWAAPTTLTGSIGVFGIYPTLEGSFQKLGIHSDGLGTTHFAGAFRVDAPLHEDVAKVLQLGVESIYVRFLNVVAESRQSDPMSIHEVAQGRVWTGATAKELGLVDEIGYLTDALSAAAQLAGLDEVHVKLIERDLTPQEQILRQLLDSDDAQAYWRARIASWIGLDAPLLQQVMNTLKPFNDLTNIQQQGVYAICLECSQVQ